MQTILTVLAICCLFLFTSETLLAGVVTLDSTFNGTGYRIQTISPEYGSIAESVAIQSDGKIVLGGFSLGVAFWDKFALMRVNPDGTMDSTFNGSGYSITQISNFNQGYKVLVQPDGRVLLSGARFSGSTYNDFTVLRYTSEGILDLTFDGNGVAAHPFTAFSEDFSYDMALQPDGKMVLVGSTAGLTDTGEQSPPSIGIIRLNPDGSLDPTFAGQGRLIIEFPDVSESANAVIVQDDGKIVLGGFVFNGVKDVYLLIRLQSDGSIDTTFGNNGLTITSVSGGSDKIITMSTQSDGKIVVGGSGAIARYSPNGILDTSFGNNGIAVVPHYVAELLPTRYDKILVAGASSAFAAVSRYTRDGQIDTSFDDGGTVLVGVAGRECSGRGIAVDEVSRIVLGGTCTSSGKPHFTVFRLYEEETAEEVPFDFDGDGKTDVSVFRPAGGEWWYGTSSNGGHGAAVFGTGSDVIAPADYTGDGVTDMAFFRPSSGEWFFLRSEDFSFYSFPFGGNGDIPAPADYDGDGKADAAVYRPSTGTWYVFRSSDSQVSITGFGVAGDQPIPADYDGDGMADIGIFRPNGTNGAEWWVLRSTAGLLAVQFGGSDVKAVPGDYTGDGKADVAFFNTTGEWYILRSEDLSFYSFPFGVGSDIPVPGDYDGDGRIDAAVFRDSSATWFMQGSTSGTMITGFGVPGDRPVPNAFIR